MSKKLRSLATLVLMITLLPFLSLPAYANTQGPWTGKIRPGFVTGSGENPTDIFVDILVPLKGDDKSLLFFNPNFRFDDDSGNEQNIGFGYRKLISGDKYIIGANAYFDSMESKYNNRYKQFGLGVELLSDMFDIHANYYHPFGDTEQRVEAKDWFIFTNSSLFKFEGWEEALQGYDATAYVLIPGISDKVETRAFAGAFWYDSAFVDDDDVSGYKYGAEVRPADFLSLSVELRDTDIRGTDTFVGGYLELPFSIENITQGKSPFGNIKTQFATGARKLTDRMTDKVIRDKNIVVEAYGVEDIDRFLNPLKGTSKVAEMIFVNKDNIDPDTPGGDGSYADPYQDVMSVETHPLYIAEADNVWVYTFSYDDIADVYYDTAITLLPNWTFWGQGYKLANLGGGPNPVLDGGEEPDFGPAPAIFVIDDPIIRLAENNTVMGLTLQNATHGIYGTDIKKTNIHNNTIRNTSDIDSAIHIENYFDPTDFTGQTLSYTIANNQIHDNGGYGIYL